MLSDDPVARVRVRGRVEGRVRARLRKLQLIDMDEALARSAGEWVREKQTESERSWASEKGGRLGLQGGDSGCWRGC